MICPLQELSGSRRTNPQTPESPFPSSSRNPLPRRPASLGPGPPAGRTPLAVVSFPRGLRTQERASFSSHSYLGGVRAPVCRRGPRAWRERSPRATARWVGGTAGNGARRCPRLTPRLRSPEVGGAGGALNTSDTLSVQNVVEIPYLNVILLFTVIFLKVNGF